MSITITISPEAQSKLEKRAAVFGQDLKTFVRNLLEREAAQSLTDAAKPIYRQTEENKTSENELENLIDETLAEVRREKPLASR
jgi:acyl-[acyl carrier protein]--UDP-N-acetylglucosamine O-acyltransferase